MNQQWQRQATFALDELFFSSPCPINLLSHSLLAVGLHHKGYLSPQGQSFVYFFKPSHENMKYLLGKNTNSSEFCVQTVDSSCFRQRQDLTARIHILITDKILLWLLCCFQHCQPFSPFVLSLKCTVLCHSHHCFVILR